MTLTKVQIVESVQNQTGFPKNRSSEIVETLLEIINNTLVSGEDVLVKGMRYTSKSHPVRLFNALPLMFLQDRIRISDIREK